ncbi:MAG: hypothetical protein Q9221_005843 [Calogaya cf. arnoldii]
MRPASEQTPFSALARYRDDGPTTNAWDFQLPPSYSGNVSTTPSGPLVIHPSTSDDEEEQEFSDAPTSPAAGLPPPPPSASVAESVAETTDSRVELGSVTSGPSCGASPKIMSSVVGTNSPPETPLELATIEMYTEDVVKVSAVVNWIYGLRASTAADDNNEPKKLAVFSTIQIQTTGLLIMGLFLISEEVSQSWEAAEGEAKVELGKLLDTCTRRIATLPSVQKMFSGYPRMP